MLNLTVPDGTQLFAPSQGPYFGLRNKTWCFERAVLLGSNMFGFPDMVTAHEFRRVVYERFDIPVPVTPEPPRHVVLLDRDRTKPRHFSNLKGIMDIMAKYDVVPEYTILTNNATFEEQVRLMARTGLFVTMHGAGIMNEIFLPPGAAVIEIFPVHLKHVLYERIAHYSGLYHFKVRCHWQWGGRVVMRDA